MLDEKKATIAEVKEKFNKLAKENKLLREQNSKLKANKMPPSPSFESVKSFVWLLRNIMF